MIPAKIALNELRDHAFSNVSPSLRSGYPLLLWWVTIHDSKQLNRIDVDTPPRKRPMTRMLYSWKCLVAHEALYSTQKRMHMFLRPNLSANPPTNAPVMPLAPNPIMNRMAID